MTEPSGATCAPKTTVRLGGASLAPRSAALRVGVASASLAMPPPMAADTVVGVLLPFDEGLGAGAAIWTVTAAR